MTADFVAMENTGLVHIAPGHGWDDYVLGAKEDLAIVCPVDGAGKFLPAAGIFAGKVVRDANGDVLDALCDHLLATEKITHRYGHCWRCKTPIIFRATSQWFLKALEIRDLMLSEVEKVAWYPEWAGSARFYDWIKEARDWCISRQRYWGIPIPVWVCTKCDRYRVIGTIAELEKTSGSPCPIRTARSWTTVTIPCECGGAMHRVGTSSMSGSIPRSRRGPRLASRQRLRTLRNSGRQILSPKARTRPGAGSTRNWAQARSHSGRRLYKSVCMHGFALDAEGKKMSKSLGNVVSPEEVVAKVGVDVLRFYVLSSSAPGTI